MNAPNPQPSIAELIGKGQQQWLISSVKPYRKVKNGWHCKEPVTVDDMLDWICTHPNVDAVATGKQPHPAGVGPIAWVEVTFASEPALVYHDKTVASACEAAVRFIAAADRGVL